MVDGGGVDFPSQERAADEQRVQHGYVQLTLGNFDPYELSAIRFHSCLRVPPLISSSLFQESLNKESVSLLQGLTHGKLVTQSTSQIQPSTT